MKAISLKPAGTAINFRAIASLATVIKDNTLSIAIIGTAVALITLFLEIDSVAIPAVFASLGAVYYESEIKEGGQK